MTTDHERLTELLPWYVNATLSEEETALVEAHLGSCDLCRGEMGRLQELSAATAAEAPGWTPSPAHFNRVLRNLTPSLWQRLRAWTAATPRPVRFAFAFQGAAVLALLAVVLVGRPHVYETLSRQPAAAVSQRARLHVLFAPDLTESGLREILQSAGAIIVDGPTDSGLYTIELPLAASDVARAGEIASRIASQPKVRFAAPVAR
jgi:anti-sigma factor RsiW